MNYSESIKHGVILINLIGACVALLFTLFAVLIFSGCTTAGVGGRDYTARQVRGEQSVRLGTVVSQRMVTIQPGKPGAVGVLGGAVAGAALGHTMGQGGGNSAATALGAVAGAAAGNAIENKAETQNGVEITIRLDSGYVIAVTQGADELFQTGERVQVLGGGGATRVTRLDPASPLNPSPSGGVPGYAPPPPPPQHPSQ